MNPQFRNAALIAAALGLLVSLYFALRPGDDNTSASTTTAATIVETSTTEGAATTTEPTTTEAPSGPVRFNITAGGSIERGKVREGSDVVIHVTADVSDEVHFHGYDLSANVAPGKPAEIEFTADIPGQFEIELENRGQLIGVLEVSP
jgi:hypothetical protein